MAKVKIAPKLPDDDSTLNGLDAIAAALLKEPKRGHLAVVLLDCAQVTTDHHRGGAQQPTAGIVHIEVPEDQLVAAQLRDILEAAHRRRTQKDQPVVVQPAAFRVDTSTGDHLDTTDSEDPFDN